MKHYINFECKLFLKNRKTQFIALFLLTFAVGLVFFIQYQNVGDIRVELYDETTEMGIAADQFNDFQLEEPENQRAHDNLVQQRTILVRQDNNLLFGDMERFNAQGLALANLRLDGYEEGYGEIDPSFLVSYEQALQDQAMFSYLIDQQMPAAENTLNGSSYLSLLLIFFGSFVFFVILLLASDILTADAEHSSIVESYPISFSQKITSKMLIQVMASFLLFLLMLLCGYVVMSILHEPGNLSYPEIFYQDALYEAIPLYQYLLLTLLYLFVLLVHIVLLSLLLNRLFRNAYLNLFAGGLLYFFPYLFPNMMGNFFFLPMNYFDPASVINGSMAGMLSQPTVSFSAGMGFLVLWSVIYAAILSVLDYRQTRMIHQTERSGT